MALYQEDKEQQRAGGVTTNLVASPFVMSQSADPRALWFRTEREGKKEKDSSTSSKTSTCCEKITIDPSVMHHLDVLFSP